MALEMTHPSLSVQAQGVEQVQVIWTQASGSGQAVEGELQPQLKATNELVSHSSFTENIEHALPGNSTILPTQKIFQEPNEREDTISRTMRKDDIPIKHAVNMASAAQDGFDAEDVFNVTNVDVLFLAPENCPFLSVDSQISPVPPSSVKACKPKCDQHTECHPKDVNMQSRQPEEKAASLKMEEPATVTIESETEKRGITSLFKSARLTIFNHVHRNQHKPSGKKRKRKAPTPSRKVVYYTKEMGYYRQCFQPRFEYPHSCNELLICKGADFLIVFVGLCNILLLQFILVVLTFFSQEEINQDTFKENSYSSNAFGRPW